MLLSVTVTKKNRKYFAAKNDQNYPCKILIDEISENLEIDKELHLEVDDISIRSKYGTDLIYKLSRPAKRNPWDEVVIIKLEKYNKFFVDEARKLGGKYDRVANTWTFPKYLEERVEQLDFIYNSEIVPIKITAGSSCYTLHDSLTFMGYSVAKATGRDSGAELYDGVSCLKGKVTSGGSMKNWCTEAEEESELILSVSKNIFDSEFKEKEIVWLSHEFLV